MRTIPFRRKQEGKTNYDKRLKLLISGSTRVVIRKSLKNITVQFVNYDSKGDVVVAAADSRQLIKLGWNFSRNNLPAAYLTGLLAGKKAVEKGVKSAIADIGLNQNVKGCKLYSAVKGVMDAGVIIPCSKEVLPSDDRLSGKHIMSYGKSKDASKIVESFNDVKKKILGK